MENFEDEIKNKAKKCKRQVRKYAALSSAASVVPVPGVDIAVDITLLMKMINEINRSFGLSKEQIDNLPPEDMKFMYQIIKSIGVELIGRMLTKDMILMALKRYAASISAKEVAKYAPFVGQTLSALISAALFIYIGNEHVNSCCDVLRAYEAEKKQENA